LVLRQNSSGGKDRLGGISKIGDRYLLHLLVVGATAVVRYTRRKTTTISLCANRLLDRKPARLVTVAVANKMARIAWAVMARNENYRATRSFAANAVRLQLHALAYNLDNFMRTLALPKAADPWSLTSLREKLIKTTQQQRQRYTSANQLNMETT
jgi:DDE family transposase/transposase IS116/IS110/IS902 family protein